MNVGLLEALVTTHMPMQDVTRRRHLDRQSLVRSLTKAVIVQANAAALPLRQAHILTELLTLNQLRLTALYRMVLDSLSVAHSPQYQGAATASILKTQHDWP